jgi:hypothetical protein
LIASRKEDGTWTRVFYHKFSSTAYPLLVWDKEQRVLLVGANYSDSNTGDIVWDAARREYNLVYAIGK